MRDILFQEKKKHGMPDFPAQYYFVDCNHPRYVMNIHWHNEFEIVRVKIGELRLYINNRIYILRKDDIAFICGKAMHRSEPIDCVYDCVVFDPRILYRNASDRIANYILPIISEGTEIYLEGGLEYTELKEAVNELFCSISDQDKYFELKLYSSAAKIIYMLYSQHCIHTSNNNRHSEHRKAIMLSLIEWIENNHTEKITLEELATIAGTNKKYLCRFFKEYTGDTPINYVNRIRIERACIMLASGGVNITEIAFENGFNDTSYFCKLFKRYKGITPREYSALIEKNSSSEK